MCANSEFIILGFSNSRVGYTTWRTASLYVIMLFIFIFCKLLFAPFFHLSDLYIERCITVCSGTFYYSWCFISNSFLNPLIMLVTPIMWNLLFSATQFNVALNCLSGAMLWLRSSISYRILEKQFTHNEKLQYSASCFVFIFLKPHSIFHVESEWISSNLRLPCAKFEKTTILLFYIVKKLVQSPW